MAQGDYIKALKMLSRAKGWDPDELIANDGIGLPVNIQRRAGAWEFNAEADSPDRTLSFEANDWQGEGETPISGRATKNANPYAGKGWSTPRSARPPGLSGGGGGYGEEGENTDQVGDPGTDSANQGS